MNQYKSRNKTMFGSLPKDFLAALPMTKEPVLLDGKYMYSTMDVPAGDSLSRKESRESLKYVISYSPEISHSTVSHSPLSFLFLSDDPQILLH